MHALSLVRDVAPTRLHVDLCVSAETLRIFLVFLATLTIDLHVVIIHLDSKSVRINKKHASTIKDTVYSLSLHGVSSYRGILVQKFKRNILSHLWTEIFPQVKLLLSYSVELFYFRLINWLIQRVLTFWLIFGY